MHKMGDRPTWVNAHCGMQGIIQNSHTTWTQFKPVAVPQLPYMARRPVSTSLAMIELSGPACLPLMD